MCGRYHRTRADRAVLRDWYGVEDWDEALNLQSNYNVAPQTFQPVVRLGRDSGRRELALARWGLVPSWSKDGKSNFATINARAETASTSPVFRSAIKSRRCLVPADGFYEWKKIDQKNKQPYAIGLVDGSPLSFAGLWEAWFDPVTKQPLETYSIITTEPNELMASIHDRMPVILEPRDYSRWLAPADPAQLPVDLLRPFDADRMKAWPVGRAVGNVKNNDSTLLASL